MLRTVTSIFYKHKETMHDAEVENIKSFPNVSLKLRYLWQVSICYIKMVLSRLANKVYTRLESFKYTTHVLTYVNAKDETRLSMEILSPRKRNFHMSYFLFPYINGFSWNDKRGRCGMVDAYELTMHENISSTLFVILQRNRKLFV